MKAFHEAKLGRRDFLLHCHELTIRKTAALNMRVALIILEHLSTDQLCILKESQLVQFFQCSIFFSGLSIYHRIAI